MYYKIENKESEVYKQLHELRALEKQINEENKKAIEEKTGMQFEEYLGYSQQQTAWRTIRYEGFKFLSPEKICLKTWKIHNFIHGCYVPNKRTKAGREMANFLLNGLKCSDYRRVFDILEIEIPYRLVFPYVEIIGDVIILHLRDREPEDKNVIEITKKELDSYFAKR